MAVVGGDDEGRFVPIAVGFDPGDHGADRVLAAVDRADGVIEVVLVEGEVNVAGFDEEKERLSGFRCQHGQGGFGHVGEGRLFLEVGGGVLLGAAVEVGRRVEAAVGGAIGQVVERFRAEEAEEAMAAVDGATGGGIERRGPRNIRRGGDDDILAAVGDVGGGQVRVGEIEVARRGVLPLG